MYLTIETDLMRILVKFEAGMRCYHNQRKRNAPFGASGTSISRRPRSTKLEYCTRGRFTPFLCIRFCRKKAPMRIHALSHDLLDMIQSKKSELSSEKKRRLANLVDFVGEGRGSKALAKALTEAE